MQKSKNKNALNIARRPDLIDPNASHCRPTNSPGLLRNSISLYTRHCGVTDCTVQLQVHSIVKNLTHSIPLTKVCVTHVIISHDKFKVTMHTAHCCCEAAAEKQVCEALDLPTRALWKVEN